MPPPRITPTFLLLSLALAAVTGFSITNPRLNKFDTKVSVDGKSSVYVHPTSNAVTNNVTLTNYMRLPVEQYVLIPMPLGSSLTRVDEIETYNQQSAFGDINSDETLFELVVPTIKFFNLSLQPVVYATVQPQLNQVVISSNKCILHGSPFIEKVKLNDRFVFNVQCTLTWEDSASELNTQQMQTTTISDTCSISAETIIDVDVNVPRPFNSIPKPILQRTGNAAMKLSMKYIQGSFLQNLARDYEKWSNDEEYRMFRASLSRKEERVNVPLEV